MCAGAVEGAPRAVQQRRHILHIVERLGRDQLLRLRCGQPQVFEVAQPLGALAELGVLAPLRVDRFDVGERRPEAVRLRQAPLPRLDQRVELRALRLPPAVERLLLGEERGETRPGLNGRDQP